MKNIMEILPDMFLLKVSITQRGKHIVQVLLVDEAISILVDHVEGLFELLDL